MKNAKKTLLVFTTLLLLPKSIVFAAAFEDPLGGASLSDLIQKVINWLLGMIGLLALLAVVFGGFKIITAFGDEKKVAEGKSIIFWAVGGVAIAALAWVAISAVQSALGV